LVNTRRCSRLVVRRRLEESVVAAACLSRARMHGTSTLRVGPDLAAWRRRTCGPEDSQQRHLPCCRVSGLSDSVAPTAVLFHSPESSQLSVSVVAESQQAVPCLDIGPSGC
jgi:hypothetical protein